MPTYEYECEICGHKLDAFHAMSAEPLVICPECGKSSLIKMIGMGSAVIVRGTETPCHGGKVSTTQKKQSKNPEQHDKLGRGKNKGETPFWRDGPINKKVLKNPEKYIREGKVD